MIKNSKKSWLRLCIRITVRQFFKREISILYQELIILIEYPSARLVIAK